jgi:hypothetical protein
VDVEAAARPRRPAVRLDRQLDRPPLEPMATRQPIVHVSIGRIEVRAVTPPPLAVRTAPPTPDPAPSLEMYLRARNGTGR